jgi:outer membrane protein assembly factor BamB
VVWIQSGGVSALSAADGKVLWRAWLGNSAQSAPVITEGGIYITVMEGHIYALE